MSDDEPMVISTGDWLKSVSAEVTFQGVDPEVLGLLTGGVLGSAPEPTFAVEVHAPIKRTFWQWLRRKPKRWQYTYIPHARLTQEDR